MTHPPVENSSHTFRWTRCTLWLSERVCLGTLNSLGASVRADQSGAIARGRGFIFPKSEIEGGLLAWVRVGPDASLMLFNDALDGSKADARALELGFAMEALKRREDPRGRVDALLASIGNARL